MSVTLLKWADYYDPNNYLFIRMRYIVHILCVTIRMDSISYHVTFFPHRTFLYYKNIQIRCINFSIVISKIHIGFSSENRLAESNYSIAINPLFVNRMLRTHGWNILKACNFTAKRKQFQFQCRFKERNWLNFFFRTLKRYSR